MKVVLLTGLNSPGRCHRTDAVYLWPAHCCDLGSVLMGMLPWASGLCLMIILEERLKRGLPRVQAALVGPNPTELMWPPKAIYVGGFPQVIFAPETWARDMFD